MSGWSERAYRPRAALFTLLCACTLTSVGERSASAHTRSTSYATWAVYGHDAVVTLQLSLLDREALGPMNAPDETVSERLQSQLTLGIDGAGCPPVAGAFATLVSRYGFVTYEWRVRCPRAIGSGAGQVRLASQLLFDAAPGHVHFAAIEPASRRIEAVLTSDRRAATFDLAAGASPSGAALDAVGRFVHLGVSHILSGWDHLVFVVVLMCAVRRLRHVAVVVTGFTIGHSVTLALAASGHLAVNSTGVEALIGLSIALVAIDGAWLTCARSSAAAPVVTVLGLLLSAILALTLESARIAPLALVGLAVFASCYFPLLARAPAPMGWRGAVAALFGLIHGFGFAGALAPLATAGDAVSLPALVGFNLGVELGQLGVIALAWPVFVLARRVLGNDRVTVAVSSAGLAVGVALFFSRAFG